MKSAKSKRQFTLLTLVVALGVAVYLNWEYAKTDAPFALQDPGAVSANAAPVLEVTRPTHFGIAGRGFLCSGANRPSLSSFSLSCSNAICIAPIPSGNISST